MTKDRVVLFIDARNILGGCAEHQKQAPNYQFGYREILDYFAKDHKVIRGYYYDGAPHKDHYTMGSVAND